MTGALANLKPFEASSSQIYVLSSNSRIIYSSIPEASYAIPEALQHALTQEAASVHINKSDYLLQQMFMDHGKLSAVVLVTTDSVFHDSTQALFWYIAGFCFIITATIIGIIMLTYFFTRDVLTLNREISRFGRQHLSACGHTQHH